MARTLASVPYKKKRKSHPMMRTWLRQLGDEVRKKREEAEEKQGAFLDRIRVSRTTLSAIENGTRSYNVEPLIEVLAGLSPEPAKLLVEQEFAAYKEAHRELHRRLQELLDADGDWPMAAAVNVDAVWSLYQERKKKRKVS